jgi:hypothetical protein
LSGAPLDPALVAARLRAVAAMAPLAGAAARSCADMSSAAVARRLREASRLARVTARLAAAGESARRHASGE